jgi:hypothetical protein
VRMALRRARTATATWMRHLVAQDGPTGHRGASSGTVEQINERWG